MNAETVKQENQEDLDKKDKQGEAVENKATESVEPDKSDDKQKVAAQGSAAVSNQRVLENNEVKLTDEDGNTEIKTIGNAERISVVCYFRKKMTECGSSKEELERIKNK